MTDITQKDSPFFMVWATGNKSTGLRYRTREEAQTEAERLAKVHPGYEFFVMQALSGHRLTATPLVARVLTTA